MYFSFLFLFFIPFTKSFSLQKRQVCDDILTLCYPTLNETWYHYNYYTFVINQNHTLFVNRNITVFDLHLETVLYNNNSEKSSKSWFNLTRTLLKVQVTDDWFPITLPNGSLNKTWIFNVTLRPHDIFELQDSQAIQFNVIQSSPKPFIINKERLAHKWILAIIIIACIIVIIAICIIVWLWKNMQKMKKQKEKKLEPYQNDMQSSILSTPDAKMIADTFRQVLSTCDLDNSRKKVGQDLLDRELQSQTDLHLSLNNNH